MSFFLEEYLFNTPRIFSNSTFILSEYQDDEDKPTVFSLFRLQHLKKLALCIFYAFSQKRISEYKKKKETLND